MCGFSAVSRDELEWFFWRVGTHAHYNHSVIKLIVRFITEIIRLLTSRGWLEVKLKNRIELPTLDLRFAKEKSPFFRYGKCNRHTDHCLWPHKVHILLSNLISFEYYTFFPLERGPSTTLPLFNIFMELDSGLGLNAQNVDISCAFTFAPCKQNDKNTELKFPHKQ